MAVCVVVGIVVGTFYANHFSGRRLNIINSGSNRLTNLLHIIDDQYVDQVDIDSLVEEAIPQILSELDPHSVYISAADVAMANDDLKGSFSGIGIEFTLRNDTIHVQNVISGGPAEHAGLLAGDKIVTVDHKPFTGDSIDNAMAMRHLKGPEGTKVTVGVTRFGQKEPLEYTITRGEIPLKSIASAYMYNDNTGYIRIKNFGETTYPEMLNALVGLSLQGMESLIIDLRGNTGGLLTTAVQIVNEFLPRNQLIVYTEGRKSPRQEYTSNGHGNYDTLPLVVLIDEQSASAAEIFAGAIQDNDRGMIVGRRSFGKGLVQQQLEFSDHSLIRLTIARYYTPSGRCIQKPYTAGVSSDYELDLMNRYEHGEFFSQDSIKHEGPEYHTRIGRTVYGGGGITPDIFVPEDTTGITNYYRQAAMSGLILQFAYNYTDDNRQTLAPFTDWHELDTYLQRQNIVDRFATYADQHGLKRRNIMIQQSHKLLSRYLISRIVYNMLNEDAWTQYINTDDPVILQSIELIDKGEAFPKNDEEADEIVALNRVASGYPSMKSPVALVARA